MTVGLALVPPLQSAAERSVKRILCCRCKEEGGPVVLLFLDRLERYFVQVFCQMCGAVQPGMNSMDPKKSELRRRSMETHRDTQRRKEQALVRQMGQCANFATCYQSTDSGASFELDHIVAIADGGEDTDSNVQALCVYCHHQKTIAENDRRRSNR